MTPNIAHDPFVSVPREQKTEDSSDKDTLFSAHQVYFARKGSHFIPTSDRDLEIFEHLPAATYIIRETRTGFLIDQVANFQLPDRMYGDVQQNADRILNTYMDRPGSTGVLLSGEKGSGKTLLAKYVAETARVAGIPTVVINEPLAGDGFFQLLQSITQPCIVIFDEFEKVYDRDKQQDLLTILDGVFPTKKLFIFTCNDKYAINLNMTNRPGRIYYALEYSGLEDSFIREYCSDRLKNKEHVEGVCRIAGLFSQFNFDILQSLVQEMNRYGESPIQAMRFLNAKPEAENSGMYAIQMLINNQEVDICPDTWYGHPLHRQEFTLERDMGDDENVNYTLSASDLKNIDVAQGQYVFVKENVQVTFTKRKTNHSTWSSAYEQYF